MNLKRTPDSIRYLLFFLLAVQACDNEENTLAIETRTTTVFMSKQSSTLINTRGYFIDTFKAGARFNIVEQPNQGRVDLVADGEYFMYEPFQSSGDLEGDDDFTAEIVSASGVRLGRTQFNLRVADECGLGPVVSYVKIAKGSSCQINLLSNDVFCNIAWEDAAVGVRKTLNAPGAWSFALSVPTGTATFTYNPDAYFTGKAEFYYDLAVNPSPGIASWNEEMMTTWADHPEMFERYFSGKLVVEVE